MRGLTGDFSTMPLKDLVVYLANRLATGTLTLEHGTIIKQAVLDQGAVVNVSSNVPREFLGQFLINLGHINEEQFHRAWATQQETKVFLGRILLMIGLITEENLAAVLQLKFRETLLEAFDWRDGTFAFEAGATPSMPEGVQVKLPLIDVHKEADFRVQAWKHFRRAFPHGSCTLTLKRENLEEPPRPGSMDEKVLHFIDAGMTLEEIGLRLHATDFFLYNRLYALYRLGALIVHDRPENVPLGIQLGLGENPSAEQLLEHARKFELEGNLRDAWALARRANQVSPSLDAAVLLRHLEAGWLPRLKAELIAPARKPTVTLSPGELAKLPLSAPERYLISRVDGRRTVENIIRVAPLREIEALAFVDRFVAQKWISLS
ncbi:MAG: DUF4388 domain-containing protein [Myxococcota bacterium]